MTTRAELDRVAVLAAEADSARAVLAAGITCAVEDGRLELPDDLAHLVARYQASATAWIAAVDDL